MTRPHPHPRPSPSLPHPHRHPTLTLSPAIDPCPSHLMLSAPHVVRSRLLPLRSPHFAHGSQRWTARSPVVASQHCLQRGSRRSSLITSPSSTAPPRACTRSTSAVEAHRRAVCAALRRDPFAEAHQREASVRDKYKPPDKPLADAHAPTAAASRPHRRSCPGSTRRTRRARRPWRPRRPGRRPWLVWCSARTRHWTAGARCGPRASSAIRCATRLDGCQPVRIKPAEPAPARWRPLWRRGLDAIRRRTRRRRARCWTLWCRHTSTRCEPLWCDGEKLRTEAARRGGYAGGRRLFATPALGASTSTSGRSSSSKKKTSSGRREPEREKPGPHRLGWTTTRRKGIHVGGWCMCKALGMGAP